MAWTWPAPLHVQGVQKKCSSGGLSAGTRRVVILRAAPSGLTDLPEETSLNA